ncbi:hypothetical protein J3A84_04915 [Proteiniclasticum sp. SCR006]|uniref:Uncharacterized protein n=1 Tax=Proteiniclasticum aestuarii TaxID=2817862 RepID=A0A939HAH2_9CLOT|nr:hypothetical protein [Proteiniclasticum aestuarii]MBO1264382.1 hypothetical protein [Proteiniclasticum aestuarii]
MQDIKDIQLQILGQTIGTLHGEIAELRATVIVQNNYIATISKEQEVQDGEHQDSAADESDNA